MKAAIASGFRLRHSQSLIPKGSGRPGRVPELSREWGRSCLQEEE